MFDKEAQFIARFKATDTLIVTFHSVTMPVGFAGDGMKRNGRPLHSMSHIKRSIVKVRADENCFAHALVKAIARSNKNATYKAYSQSRKISPEVRQLIETTGIDLKNGGGIPGLTRFQENFHEYKTIVHSRLNCDSIIYQGHV